MKKLMKSLSVALVLVSLLTCLPLTSAAALSNDMDDILFDAQYYAAKYPDLGAAGLKSEHALRNHWNQYGK